MFGKVFNKSIFDGSDHKIKQLVLNRSGGPDPKVTTAGTVQPEENRKR